MEKPDGGLLDNVTSQGKSYIDGLNESPEHGVNKMKLWGWAFLTTDKLRSPDDFYRALILISE